MPADVRYVFGDARTGAIYDEIPMEGVTVMDSLNGGEVQGTIGLQQTGRDSSDLYGATVPGKSFLVVERNDQPIWGGLVWSRTYQSQAESVQVYAKTYDAYPTKRIMDFDQSWTATDPRNIFLQLYQLMQVDPMAIQVDLPSAFTPDLSTIDFTVTGSELKTFRTAFDQLAQTDPGFEWRVVVTRVGGAYVRSLNVGLPYLGQPLGNTSAVFEYPGSILNFWRNDTISSSGTNVYGVGGGEGENMPIVEVVHDDLVSFGWPRFDVATPQKDIVDIDLLEKITQSQAAILKAPSGIYTVEAKADQSPQFGEWGIGDYAQLVLTSALEPRGLTTYKRIIQYDYTPPRADAVEEVRLTFEGDDLA